MKSLSGTTLGLLLALLSGCTAVTRARPQRFPLGLNSNDESESIAAENRDHATRNPNRPLDDGYLDFSGVIHIHTRYSHDAHGTIQDVIETANEQKLDYAIITEHNNLKPVREGWPGWHDGTLLLVGMEISARGGHYLAFNVSKEIDREHLDTQQIIDEVNRQGGLGFIAHPYFKNGPWRDWSVHGFTGIEAYNVAHDTLDENKARLALWTLTAAAEPFYLSILDRPYDPIAKWDELIQRFGRVVGIGSVDAHEFHALGVKFARYEDLFQMARTHVLIPSSELSAAATYEAYRKGHVYIGIAIMGNPSGFTFMATDSKNVLGIMGDEVALAEELELTVLTAAAAQLTLYKDGQIADARIGARWHIPVKEPGVYRVEASRHGKPWIISNPIYVRPSLTRGDSPAS